MNKEWGRGPTDCEFRIGLRKLLCSGAIRILCANIDKLRAAEQSESYARTLISSAQRSNPNLMREH